MNKMLPVEIAKEADELISELQAIGWTISAAHYDARSFGNWYVDLCKANDRIRLTKDRSQYTFSGPSIPEIQAAALWKAFDNLEEFRHAVAKWAVIEKTSTQTDPMANKR
jgi:hypothetical protein